jgi:ribonuclease HII
MIGVDEVGRGAWAGPLLVCAARLKVPINGLKDSKQLSPKKRAELAIIIKSQADVGYGWVSANEIDDIGLSASLKLATTKALQEIDYQTDEELVIDGTVNFVPDLKATCMPKADNLVPAISAASIVAKVTRDQYMAELAKKYPNYGFEKHVGYGTKVHAEAIKTHGFCSEHRRSYKINFET